MSIASMRRLVGYGAAILVSLAGLAFTAPSVATAQGIDDPGALRGVALYRDVGFCAFCHGWTGTGGIPGDEGAAGPSLVETLFELEDIIEIVSCGTELGMPQHLRVAWTAERPCWGGIVAADLEIHPPAAERTLNERQIRDIATWIIAAYKGKEMTFETCAVYWGENSRNCTRLRN